MNLGPAAAEIARGLAADEPFRIMYVSGDFQAVYTFATGAIAADWNSDLLDIKSHMAQIHSIRENDRDNKCDADYDPWLNRVHRFRRVHGNDFVPGDIKQSLHDVPDANCVPRNVF